VLDAHAESPTSPSATKRCSVPRALIRAMRPKQWFKNVFVFAGLLFDGKFLQVHYLLNSLAAFAIFCLASGAIYLFNDLRDVESDRAHPRKRLRPIASGELPAGVARVTAYALLAACLPLAFLFGASFGWTVAGYVALMILYSLYLKRVVIIDVMTVAAGFVLRVVAGAMVVSVSRFSPWLYVCTTLLALFIALNRRRHELVLLQEQANAHRSVLDDYNLEFIDSATSVVTAMLVVSYSLYTFSAPNLPANHAMMLTIPFVLYGVFRYLYLIHVRQQGGAPEDLVLGDRPLLLTVALWVLTAGLVIYGNPLF